MKIKHKGMKKSRLARPGNSRTVTQSIPRLAENHKHSTRLAGITLANPDQNDEFLASLRGVGIWCFLHKDGEVRHRVKDVGRIMRVLNGTMIETMAGTMTSL